MYIREAHPTDGRALAKNKFIIPDPKTIEERQKVASEFASQLKVTIPILVDTVDDLVGMAYSASPDRIYIIDADGKVALKSGPGPGGFRPGVEAAPSVLDRLLKISPKQH